MGERPEIVVEPFERDDAAVAEVRIAWGSFPLAVRHVARSRSLLVGAHPSCDIVVPGGIADAPLRIFGPDAAGAVRVLVPVTMPVSWVGELATPPSESAGGASSPTSRSIALGGQAELRLGVEPSTLTIHVACVRAARAVPRRARLSGRAFVAAFVAVAAHAAPLVAGSSPEPRRDVDATLEAIELTHLLAHAQPDSDADTMERTDPEPLAPRCDCLGTAGCRCPEGQASDLPGDAIVHRWQNWEDWFAAPEDVAELITTFSAPEAWCAGGAPWSSLLSSVCAIVSGWPLPTGVGEPGARLVLMEEDVDGPQRSLSRLGFGRLPPQLFSGRIRRVAPRRVGPQSVRVGHIQVSGRLPLEVVARVVRQNHGRFRFCYAEGLRGNPNLQGRVAARFIVGRDGAISNVGNGGSDVPDGGVVSCIVRSFYGLVFPPPETGVAVVTYPVLLRPEG